MPIEALIVFQWEHSTCPLLGVGEGMVYCRFVFTVMFFFWLKSGAKLPTVKENWFKRTILKILCFEFYLFALFKKVTYAQYTANLNFVRSFNPPKCATETYLYDFLSILFFCSTKKNISIIMHLFYDLGLPIIDLLDLSYTLEALWDHHS